MGDQEQGEGNPVTCGECGGSGQGNEVGIGVGVMHEPCGRCGGEGHHEPEPTPEGPAPGEGVRRVTFLVRNGELALRPDPDGKWIRAADHDTAMAAKGDRIAVLESALEAVLESEKILDEQAVADEKALAAKDAETAALHGELDRAYKRIGERAGTTSDVVSYDTEQYRRACTVVWDYLNAEPRIAAGDNDCFGALIEDHRTLRARVAELEAGRKP